MCKSLLIEIQGGGFGAEERDMISQLCPGFIYLYSSTCITILNILIYIYVFGLQYFQDKVSTLLGPAFFGSFKLVET